MLIYLPITSTRCSVATVTDDTVPTMNPITKEMQIKIKTSTLFSCDLNFHAQLVDLPDITKSSSNTAELSLRCGLENVSVKAGI